MKICIKRGSNQIGGSCVELEQNGRTLIVDLGLPLNAEENSEALLPDINFECVSGVLISHPHADHYALAHFIDKDIPVYIGAAAAGIIDAGNSYMPLKVELGKTLLFKDRESFTAGPFKVTPYLMDHSAYDSYAFLIEAGGKRVFYSGDFRAHGRKRSLFEKLIKNPPKDIDLLLLEGTAIGRAEEEFETEESLEEKFEKVFKETPGIAAVMSSAQNIDRLVTIYKAAARSGRTLVLPPHAVLISMKTGNKNIPGFKFPLVKKYTHNTRCRHEIGIDTIMRAPEKYAIFLKYSITADLLKNNLFKNAAFIYSMWEGYKNEERTAAIFDKIKEQGATMYDIHTSGHADIPTLKKLAIALKPRIITPLHTAAPERFVKIFGTNVKIRKDGGVFEL